MSGLTDLFGIDSDEWMTHPGRPCANVEHVADLWFQPAADLWAKEADRVRDTSWARELCAGCPVASQCLAYALKNNEQWGVWGGLTSNERAQLAAGDVA